MNASIQVVDRERTRELILASRAGNITKEEIKSLDSCLSLATHIWIGQINGDVVCACGLIPPSLLADEAYLWLYHTAAVEQYKFTFVRYSQIVMEQMLETYPKIIGVTDRNARSSIRWLKWLGAKFTDNGKQYIPFQIVRK
jgi:hypothetical protein